MLGTAFQPALGGHDLTAPHAKHIEGMSAGMNKVAGKLHINGLKPAQLTRFKCLRNPLVGGTPTPWVAHGQVHLMALNRPLNF